MKQAAKQTASMRPKSVLKAKSQVLYKRSVKIEIFALIFTGAFTACGALILAPVLPFYLMEHNATALDYALITSAYSFCQMLSAPLLGMLSDRVGRRPVLLGGILVSTVLYFVMSRAETVTALLLVRTILGFAGGTEPVEIAYLSDLTSRDKGQSSWINLQMKVEAVGALIGPAVGAYLAPHHGFPFLCQVMGAICAVNLVLGLVFFTEPEGLRFNRANLYDDAEMADVPQGRSLVAILAEMGRHFAHPVTGTLLVTGFLDSFAMAISDGPEAYFLNQKFHFQELDLGKLFMLCSAATLISANLVPSVLKAASPKYACVSCSVCCAAAVPMMLISKLPWVPYVYGLVLSTLTSIIEIISKTTLLSRMVPETDRGMLYGLISALCNAGFGVGAPLGGLLYDQTNRGIPYAVSAMFFAASALAYSALPRMPPGDALLVTEEAIPAVQTPASSRMSAKRAMEHCSNKVPLPNKRFAARLAGDRARRVFFVDDDLYSYYTNSVKFGRAHSIGVDSVQREMKSARRAQGVRESAYFNRGRSQNLLQWAGFTGGGG